MPTTIIPQAEMNKIQEVKKHSFLEDLKRRSYNSTAAHEARQIASANRGEFSAAHLRAFVQSNSALNTLRYICEDED